MIRIFFILLLFVFSFEVLAQTERATPKAGEGISTFLLRHNRSPNKYHDDFVKLNAKKLGKGNSLKMGVAYVIPPAKRRTSNGQSAKPEASEKPEAPIEEENDTTQVETKAEAPETSEPKQERARSKTYEPLFGKALANVKVTSNRLRGACFYVVSGHGGPDPGAIGKIGNVQLHEDEYAYDVALRLARNLMEEGAEVHIIIQDAKDGIRDDRYLSNSKRETCMGATIPLNQVARLRQRCDKINQLYKKDRKNYKYCRAIFLHVDSRSKSNQTDVFFYHSKSKSDSKRLATTMKNTFESKYDKHQPNRGFTGTVSGRDLYVLANTSPSSVFVELGNIQNAFDQRRFVMSSNRQALAKWMMEGFITDYRKAK